MLPSLDAQFPYRVLGRNTAIRNGDSGDVGMQQFWYLAQQIESIVTSY